MFQITFNLCNNELDNYFFSWKKVLAFVLHISMSIYFMICQSITCNFSTSKVPHPRRKVPRSSRADPCRRKFVKTKSKLITGSSTRSTPLQVSLQICLTHISWKLVSNMRLILNFNYYFKN